MNEVLLEGLASHLDEATVQVWFFEEGDPVEEGADLVELSTAEGTMTIKVPTPGVLVEVYYDEGETVAAGEVLCSIDDDASEIVQDTEDEEED